MAATAAAGGRLLAGARTTRACVTIGATASGGQGELEARSLSLGLCQLCCLLSVRKRKGVSSCVSRASGTAASAAGVDVLSALVTLLTELAEARRTR